MSDNTVTKKTLGGRCLDAIERVGNKLPPPAILFCWLFVIVAVIGAIFTWTDFSMINPAIKDPAKAVVKSQNLFSELAAEQPGQELHGICAHGPCRYDDAGHRYVRGSRSA